MREFALSLEKCWESNEFFSVYRAWIDRRARLDQCLEAQLFNRDCEQAETWMAAREASLEDSDGSGEGVDALLRKHEDFDRAINSQEEKIVALVTFADQLIAGDHYDKDGIAERRDKVLERCVLCTGHNYNLRWLAYLVATTQ